MGMSIDEMKNVDVRILDCELIYRETGPMILKYGPVMLIRIEQKEKWDTHCEETNNVL